MGPGFGTRPPEAVEGPRVTERVDGGHEDTVQTILRNSQAVDIALVSVTVLARVGAALMKSGRFPTHPRFQ
jgi:hypothetical protein